ncbi:MAG: CDP-alcohol phosphatidyltransferase family protein [Acidobacteria bacterium]|nr:CDP-alcohol phosphatidyltransferase family protein [Acidobacteriota bacterium]
MALRAQAATAALAGAALIAATWQALAPIVGLPVWHLYRAQALHAAGVILVLTLVGTHGGARFGSANVVTMLRLALLAFVTALVWEASTPPLAWTAAWIGLAALALDGVDGWLARRGGIASRFGARFDMEVDALLVLALAALVWHHEKAGAWILLAGLLRYLFVVAGWLRPWMRRALPPSQRRRVACVVQIGGLLLALTPAAAPGQSVVIAGVALLVLLHSFGADTLWLWRERLLPPQPAGHQGPTAGWGRA